MEPLCPVPDGISVLIPYPFLALPQICVKQCPDRYLTFLSARNSRDFDYYKQFCVPGFKNNKVSRKTPLVLEWWTQEGAHLRDFPSSHSLCRG